MGQEGIWEPGILLVLDRWGGSQETGKSCKVGRRPTQQYGNRLAIPKRKLAAGPRAGTWFAMDIRRGRDGPPNLGCLSSASTLLLRLPSVYHGRNFSTQQVPAVQERPRDMGSGPRVSWPAGGRQPEDPWVARDISRLHGTTAPSLASGPGLAGGGSRTMDPDAPWQMQRRGGGCRWTLLGTCCNAPPRWVTYRVVRFHGELS